MENIAKVLVLGHLLPAGLALLEARADVEFEMLDSPSTDDVHARIAGVDAIVVRTTLIHADAIAKAERLKVVSRHGVGYDNIDVGALTAKGIPLTVVGDANSGTVAEHTFSLLLAVAKSLSRLDSQMRLGNYAVRNENSAVELAGATLLVVGFGRIGTRVARRAEAFEMNVIVADPLVPRNTVEGHGYRYVTDFREALGEADFVTLHMPGRLDGTPVLGADEIAGMRDGAILVNCARGTLIDEPALAEALRSGKLKGAGLDVTRLEPPEDDHPYLGLENVVLTPHTAGSTLACFERMAIVSAQNALDTIDGQINPGMVVNPEVLG